MQRFLLAKRAWVVLFVLMFGPDTKRRTLEELVGELMSRPKASAA